MEKRFVIKWEIDEFAETPLEAIKKAILAMPHQGNDDTLATVFDVTELDENGKVVKTEQIDVLEENLFTAPSKLDELADIFKEIRYALPIDLKEINQEFELDNGGIAKQLLEDVCTYEIVRDVETLDAEYSQLTESDLDQIISIAEMVRDEFDKTFKRCKS